jgi:hypothetical protein
MSIIGCAVCCSTLPLKGNLDQVVDFDSAKADGGFTEDVDCLVGILEDAVPGGRLEIRFGSGQYSFRRMALLADFTGELVFLGTGRTTFRMEDSFLTLAAKARTGSLPVAMDTNSLELCGISTGRPSSLLLFHATDTVESAWNYTSNDISEVTEWEGNCARLRDRLNFCYSVERTQVTVYEPARIVVEGIHFAGGVGSASFMVLTGVRPVFRDCSFVANSASPQHNLVRLVNCYNVVAEAIKIQGEATYGFLINGSRHVRFSQIDSEGCLYPIVPSSFSSQVFIDGLEGRGSVIDAHPSFDVRYRNVTIREGKYYWNCRALGVTLEHCRFDVVPGIFDNSMYIGVVNLRPEYAYLYDRFDVTCRDVRWMYEDQGFNGLHVHHCRDFTVEDSWTHSISTGVRIRRMVVRGCRIGRLYGGGDMTVIEDSEFAGGLQKRMELLSPLRLDFDGMAVVRDCHFGGYGMRSLFQAKPLAEVFLERCRVDEITELWDTSNMQPGHQARIRMDACTMLPALHQHYMMTRQ